MHACRVNYTEDLWEALMHAAPSLPPGDLAGLLSDSYSLGMAGQAPLSHFLRFATSLPARSNFTATAPVATFLPVAPVASDVSASPPASEDASQGLLDEAASAPESSSEEGGSESEPESASELSSADSPSAVGARRSLQQSTAGDDAVVQVSGLQSRRDCSITHPTNSPDKYPIFRSEGT